MKLISYLLGLALFLSCNHKDPENTSGKIKKEIAEKLRESSEICQLLDCQATHWEEVVIYRDLYKDLHQLINKFADTSLVQTPMNDQELDSVLKNFEVHYHARLDDAIKSVDYKLFPENDSFFIYSSFFRQDSSTSTYPEKYYKTCRKALDEHLRILKAGQPASAHDPCLSSRKQ